MKRTDQWFLTTATNPLTGWSQMDNNTKHKKTKCDYNSTQCLLEAGGLAGEGGGGGRKGQDTNCQLSWTDLTWPNIQRGSVNCFESTYIAHSINCQQPPTYNYIYMFTPYPTPKALKMHKKAHTHRSFSTVKLVWKYLACWRNWIHQIIQNDDKSTGFNRSVKWNVPCSLHWQPTEMTWWEFTSLWLVG